MVAYLSYLVLYSYALVQLFLSIVFLARFIINTILVNMGRIFTDRVLLVRCWWGRSEFISIFARVGVRECAGCLYSARFQGL